MSKRKKAGEEHVNHERWLVSYADFITLLFAFFVVMYAVSSVNQGKYRVLAESLINAFHSAPQAMQPIQVGSAASASASGVSHIPRHAAVAPMAHLGLSSRINHLAIHNPIQVPQSHRYKPIYLNLGGPAEQTHFAEMTRKLAAALQSLVNKKLVVIHQNRFWVDVEINSSVLFKSGSTAPSKGAENVVDRLANVLSSFPNRIDVEGFTDNVPISTARYPSNWALSAARAVSVVHLMSKYGINPKRLAATGFGKYHPIASNKTPQGRAKNRRVELVILASVNPAKGKNMKSEDNVEPIPPVAP